MTGSADPGPERAPRARVVVAVPPGLRAGMFAPAVWRRLTGAADVTVLDTHDDRAALGRALAGVEAPGDPLGQADADAGGAEVGGA
ncbi:hypothetical protein ACWF94_34530, partial [Streptomyces sp. NPDC055078]